MQEETRIYRCQGECKTTVEVLSGQAQDLICCGQPMAQLEVQTEGEKAPTHKPVVTETETGINKFVPGGIKVDVGQVPHAMEQSHFIVWIEVEAGGVDYRRHLNPGDKPEAEFAVKNPSSVRAFCNIHGFWRS